VIIASQSAEAVYRRHSGVILLRVRPILSEGM
jgi:hypothetical protein